MAPIRLMENPSTVPLNTKQLSHNHKLITSAVVGQRAFIACAQPNDILAMKIDDGGMVPTRKYDKAVFKKKRSQVITQVSNTRRPVEKEDNKIKGLAPPVNMTRLKRGLDWPWSPHEVGEHSRMTPMAAWRHGRKVAEEAKQEAQLVVLKTTTQNSSAGLFAGLTPQDFIPCVMPARVEALVLAQRNAPPVEVSEPAPSPSAVFLGATPRTDIRLMGEVARCDAGAPRFTPNASLELDRDLSVFEDAVLEREAAQQKHSTATLLGGATRAVHGGSVEMAQTKNSNLWTVVSRGHTPTTPLSAGEESGCGSTLKAAFARTAASWGTPSPGESRSGAGVGYSPGPKPSFAATFGARTFGSSIGECETLDEDECLDGEEVADGRGTPPRSSSPRAATQLPTPTTAPAAAAFASSAMRGTAGSSSSSRSSSVWSRGSSRSTLGADATNGGGRHLPSNRSKVDDSACASFVDAGPGPHGRFPTLNSPHRLRERALERGALWRPKVTDYTFGARCFGEEDPLGLSGVPPSLPPGSSAQPTLATRRTSSRSSLTAPPLTQPSTATGVSLVTSPVAIPRRPRTSAVNTAMSTTTGPDAFFADPGSLGPFTSTSDFLRAWRRENGIYTPDRPKTLTSKPKSVRG